MRLTGTKRLANRCRALRSVSSLIACPDGVVTFANGINNRGQVAGRCQLSAAPGPFHGFIARPGG